MKELFEKLTGAVAAAKGDAEKFEAGNQAAGTRLRIGMQDIKKLAQDIRIVVQNLREEDKAAKVAAKVAAKAAKTA